MQLPAAGGELAPLFPPDDQRSSWYRQILPDDDAVPFTLLGRGPDASVPVP